MIEINKKDYDTIVNHPDHYNRPGKKECIELMEEIYGPEKVVIFCELNAFKYKYRYTEKGGMIDLAKAEWYERKAKEIRTRVKKTEWITGKKPAREGEYLVTLEYPVLVPNQGPLEPEGGYKTTGEFERKVDIRWFTGPLNEPYEEGWEMKDQDCSDLAGVWTEECGSKYHEKVIAWKCIDEYPEVFIGDKEEETKA